MSLRTTVKNALPKSLLGRALLIIVKGNAGIPKYVDGRVHYYRAPELMTDYAVIARDCDAAIITDCYDIRPKNLSKMSISLEEKAKDLHRLWTILQLVLDRFLRPATTPPPRQQTRRTTKSKQPEQ